MWRERVYNGTLRPKTEEVITGGYLSDLLDGLNYTVPTNYSTRVSEAHDVNFITTGLYLGDKYAAKDRRFLQRNGFTHVLNAAEGIDEYQVNTNQYYYKDAKITYLGIPGHDRPSWNISVYFDIAARFIDQAVKSGGKVLVHCVVGISRSATFVIAYLMIYKGMNAAEALDFVFKKRRVYPNPGFLNHLAQLNSVLNKTRQPTFKSYLL
ncbi:dual specificity protein phosphatase 3-like [Tribolium madens]|uniref:dual specificity protein phosphatase 3-like n=1 Tax=Tribolium madens TaxID=41895 RepID=UPI001CF73B11|nr:dual specificity protein phosphatase 3-like [Tribolium madens]